MTRIVIFSVTLLLITAFSGSAEGLWGSLAENIAGSRFPLVKASNLEKRVLNLPADFGGDRNLLLVAFERKQQKDVDTWLREMKRFEEFDPKFHYYELPTIQRPNSLMRWIIDNGMRRGIPDRKARERTITLYIDKLVFCDALQILDQKHIHVLLVNRTGDVLWRTEGLFDETKGEGLLSALKRSQ